MKEKSSKHNIKRNKSGALQASRCQSMYVGIMCYKYLIRPRNVWFVIRSIKCRDDECDIKSNRRIELNDSTFRIRAKK